jgi:hypothetical protein
MVASRALDLASHCKNISFYQKSLASAERFVLKRVLTRAANPPCELSFFHEFRFQIYRTDTFDLAGDIVSVGGVRQADIPDLGAALDDR